MIAPSVLAAQTDDTSAINRYVQAELERQQIPGLTINSHSTFQARPSPAPPARQPARQPAHSKTAAVITTADARSIQTPALAISLLVTAPVP
jgi:hypothetical protein